MAAFLSDALRGFFAGCALEISGFVPGLADRLALPPDSELIDHVISVELVKAASREPAKKPGLRSSPPPRE
jgi:hypothetical protein